MKKLERNIPGVYDFDEVLDYLHRGIMDMRTNVVWNLIQMQDTVTLAGQWDGRRDGVRCAFRVYEKYIYTHSRGYRLTLTMMLAGRDGRLFLSVVPGNLPFFNRSSPRLISPPRIALDNSICLPESIGTYT